MRNYQIDHGLFLINIFLKPVQHGYHFLRTSQKYSYYPNIWYISQGMTVFVIYVNQLINIHITFIY